MRSLSPWVMVWLCCTVICPPVLRSDCMSDLSYLMDCLSTKDQVYLHRAYDRYTESGRKETRKMLARIPVYASQMERALQERQIPDWVKYLTLAESRLQAQAVSPAGAVGIWQIMPATGRSLGLRINEQIDERLHTGNASQAAALYIKKLHHQFGDWLLALAAYNCGAGNVRKAQRRAKGYFYHEISHYLPRQTRRYIPRVLTIAMIAQEPEAHGFANVRSVARPVVVTASQSTSLEELADYFSCSLSLLNQFNPTFNHKRILLEGQSTAELYIPASVFHHSIRIHPMRIGMALQEQDPIDLKQQLLHPRRNNQVMALRQSKDDSFWYNNLLAFTSAAVNLGG